jgi:hypothetical protein
VDIPPENFKKEIVVGGGHMTAEEYHELQKLVYETREHGLLMQPVRGVREGLERLRAAGHLVQVITSRNEVSIAQEWCRAQGLSLDFTAVGYGASKAPACAGLDVYIDDDMDKLEPLIDIVPHRFLFSWGYNKHMVLGTVARRVWSWDEFCTAIERLQ